MGTLTTAKTRLGVSGPSKNRARPIADKGETEVVTTGKNVLFLKTAGQLINNL